MIARLALRPPALLLLGLTSMASACASILDIDEDYVSVESTPENSGGRAGGAFDADAGGSSAGGTSSGGTGGLGTGGMVGDGGGSGTGGTMPASCEQNGCNTGEKCCPSRDPANPGLLCAVPSFLVGCSMDDCEVCPEPPEHASPICRDAECAYQCDLGYRQEGAGCVLDMPVEDAGGGAGGAAVDSGGPRQCDFRQCSGCSVFGPIPCCTRDERCGCTWALGAYCAPSF